MTATAHAPAAPPLDTALERLLKRMRLPYMRKAAPELLATAKTQRWDPPRCSKRFWSKRFPDGTAPRWRPGGRGRDSPPARPSPPGTPRCRRSRHAPRPSCAPWNGCTDERPSSCAVCRGTGKTFLLEALGQHAVETGLHVAWFTLLGVLVRRHRADDTLTKAITRILRADIVVVDAIGLLPVGTDAAEGLYRLADAGYEKRSIAISSNLHPAGFDELMPKTLATATVDRLLHHAHLCHPPTERKAAVDGVAG